MGNQAPPQIVGIIFFPFIFSLMLTHYLFLCFKIVSILGTDDFNFDINSRVQDNVRSFLLRITVAVDFPFLQLQTGLFPISDFNANDPDWNANSLLLVNIKRLFMEDAVVVVIGELISV